MAMVLATRSQNMDTGGLIILALILAVAIVLFCITCIKTLCITLLTKPILYNLLMGAGQINCDKELSFQENMSATTISGTDVLCPLTYLYQKKV